MNGLPDGIYQRGKTLWMDYLGPNGERCRESTGVKLGHKGYEKEDYKKAEKVRRDRLVSIDRGEAIPDRTKLRVDAILDGLIKHHVDNKRRRVNKTKGRLELHVKRFFNNGYLSAITTETIGKYVEYRRSQDQGKDTRGRPIKPASNATINRELTLLKTAFNLVNRPFPKRPKLTENNPRSGWFTPQQLTEVCSHLPERFRAVMMFAYFTGWRLAAEIMTLTWDDVDLDKQCVYLSPDVSKNKEGRVYPYKQNKKIVALMKAQLEKKEGKYVFHMWGGTPLTTSGSFYRNWHKACHAAGCPGKSPHDFRRTAVRNYVRSPKVSDKDAQLLTGHKTRAVFERYNIVREDDLADAVGFRAKHEERKERSA